MLIAEEGGRAIGFASFHTFELIYRPRPQARLTALAVDSAHRRLGIGRELLHAVEKAAQKRGCFRIEVTTRIDSHHAQAFYSALGYQERPMRYVKRLDM
jgi:ribosomal protein S18 acetylase RimI-like enzyme